MCILKKTQTFFDIHENKLYGMLCYFETVSIGYTILYNKSE